MFLFWLCNIRRIVNFKWKLDNYWSELSLLTRWYRYSYIVKYILGSPIIWGDDMHKIFNVTLNIVFHKQNSKTLPRTPWNSVLPKTPPYIWVPNYAQLLPNMSKARLLNGYKYWCGCPQDSLITVSQDAKSRPITGQCRYPCSNHFIPHFIQIPFRPAWG